MKKIWEKGDEIKDGKGGYGVCLDSEFAVMIKLIGDYSSKTGATYEPLIVRIPKDAELVLNSRWPDHIIASFIKTIKRVMGHYEVELKDFL